MEPRQRAPLKLLIRGFWTRQPNCWAKAVQHSDAATRATVSGRVGLSSVPAYSTTVMASPALDRIEDHQVEQISGSARLRSFRPRASGCHERVGLGELVERLGSQVDAAGPHDGPRLRINGSLGEVCRVVQRLQHPSPSFG